ncbi:hypothetical protein [Streptomyces sp. GbtcB6]|uniref:hypothetical protein n=1 Tax=Streptomyces sp. GbtcB6 TaxID=2824751 RepID=UPI001C2FD0B1|nr:hypothetical protein [Streptomyces sp. GbtcB6]
MSPQSIVVNLPSGKGLEFVPERGRNYQLTVYSGSKNTRSYDGELSSDGESLTFRNIDLALSPDNLESAVWVAVKANQTALAGTTQLTFKMGGVESASTPIEVTEG